MTGPCCIPTVETQPSRDQQKGGRWAALTGDAVFNDARKKTHRRSVWQFRERAA